MKLIQDMPAEQCLAKSRSLGGSKVIRLLLVKKRQLRLAFRAHQRPIHLRLKYELWQSSSQF